MPPSPSPHSPLPTHVCFTRKKARFSLVARPSLLPVRGAMARVILTPLYVGDFLQPPPLPAISFSFASLESSAVLSCPLPSYRGNRVSRKRLPLFKEGSLCYPAGRGASELEK